MKTPLPVMPVAAVLGWPVGHSLSPRLHGFWLRQYAIDGAYVPLAVMPQALPTALRGLAALGMRGCNLTLPHKESAVGLMDRLHPSAERAGAVNTVVVASDGTLEGHNSDGFGFIANLRAEIADWQPQSGPAVILGAGGAARAAAAALLDAECPEIRLVNRSVDRAHGLAQQLGGPIQAVSWDQGAAALADAGLLVNATSLGMVGQPALEISLHRLPGPAVVTDMVYAPLVTPLLAAAAAQGNRVVDGLGMLLHQARLGFQLWFGVMPEVTPALRQHVLAARERP